MIMGLWAHNVKTVFLCLLGSFFEIFKVQIENAKSMKGLGFLQLS